MNQSYLFMPKNMLLLEFAIIAIPSFFLSLQPNKERVQGKFITHVMSGAITGALTMIICVMSMYLTKVFAPLEFKDYCEPMCMMALTFSGYVMVYRICKPLNVYRAVLCAAVLTICILAYSISPVLTDKMFCTGWAKLHWHFSYVLIVVVVLEAAFPISGWLMKLMHIIMPSAKNNRTKAQPKN